MSKKNQDRKTQFVEVCLRDAEGNVLLSAGRRSARSDKDDDTVYFLGHRADGSTAEVAVMLDEAEDYLEAVSTLVSDVDSRPYHGTLAVDTRAGSSGGSLEIAVSDPHDRTASVKILASGDPVEFDANREPLERFLFAVREGICEDLENDD